MSRRRTLITRHDDQQIKGCATTIMIMVCAMLAFVLVGNLVGFLPLDDQS